MITFHETEESNDSGAELCKFSVYQGLLEFALL